MRAKVLSKQKENERVQYNSIVRLVRMRAAMPRKAFQQQARMFTTDSSMHTGRFQRITDAHARARARA